MKQSCCWQIGTLTNSVVLFGMRVHAPQVEQYLAAVKNVEKGNVDVPLAVAILRVRYRLPFRAISNLQ